MKSFIALGLICLASHASVAQDDDTKIERGTGATPPDTATKEAPPAPKAKDEKTYPIPMVALAAVSTVMVLAAICLPMRKRDDDDE